jgi:dihydroorotate dehydrogenase electron transfer subunit
MHTGKGQVIETLLEDGQRLARISCPTNLIPSAGQYLLASDASDSPLPVPLYYTDSAPEGFLASPPIPESWMPGTTISLRGPLGRGFMLPVFARKIALVAFDDAPLRLRGLIRPSLKQGAAVVLVSDFHVDNLSDEVEAQPLSALQDVMAWADYAAFDVARVNLFELRERLKVLRQAQAVCEAQVLIRAAVPCGGVADCGVCGVSLKSGWQMACKDGPVFDLREI